MANCRSCRAEIVWVKTSKGKSAPLDAEPCPQGNVLVQDGIATVLTGSALEKAKSTQTPLYLNHFASCPNSAFHKKVARA